MIPVFGFLAGLAAWCVLVTFHEPLMERSIDEFDAFVHALGRACRRR